MGVRPEEIVVQGLTVRLYDFSTYATLWHQDKRLGNISKTDQADQWQLESGFTGSRQSCLDQLVSRHRASVQKDALGCPPSAQQRRLLEILDEKIWVYSFLQTPTLAVWTDSGHPLGTLTPDGENWRRGCEPDAWALEDCLKSMVLDFRAGQPVAIV